MAKSCPSRCRTKPAGAGAALADRAAELGETAKNAAIGVTDLVVAKAAPKVEAAWEWASPRAAEAWNKSVAVAAPKIGEAAKALAPKVDDARDLIVDRALPAIVAAADTAARVATGEDLAATKKAKRRRARRIVGWTVFAAVLSAIVYQFWRATRPVTDPWAEEEWEEFDSVPDEDIADAAGDAAEAVGEAAGLAVKAVTDAAKKAGGAVKKASSKKAPEESAEADLVG
jgi:hypothetical protein